MTDAVAELPPLRRRELLAAIGPPILFGVRLSAAVSAALFVAFYLQLENPSWAGTSASIVCQPVLGASLRKGFFRLLGTVIGAIATVVLTAVFPQDRVGFLLCMAAWCGLCSFIATLLRNFAAYAAMLAGYTMAIIASSSIAAPDQVFTLALSRGTEIAVGIVCGMLVMSLTDTGRSSHRLASSLATLISEIGSGVAAQLGHPGHGDEPFRTRRRTLIRRVASLHPLLDRTIAESPAANDRRTTIGAGIEGLFLALSAWRTLGTHLERLPSDEADQQARALRGRLPNLPAVPVDASSGPRSLDPVCDFAEACLRRAQECRDWEAATPSLRLGADRLASVLDGIGRAANAVILLGQPNRARPLRAAGRNLLPDLLPPLVNALRVFLAVGAASLVHIATAWPDGPTFVTFVAVAVILQSPRDEASYSAAVGFGLGMVLTAVVAGIVKFAVLPDQESFASFALTIGAALVPMAALSTVPSLSPVFVAATTNFIPLLGPANRLTFDTAGFYNTALAIVGGSVAGAVILRVFPPVPPRVRAARLLALTLRDLRRLARRPDRWRPDQWRTRVYGRLLVLPESADPQDGSHLLAALTIGLQLMDLHEAAVRTGSGAVPFREAANALAAGDTIESRRSLKALKDHIEGWPPMPKAARLRLQGAAREIAEVLATHAAYFGAIVR